MAIRLDHLLVPARNQDAAAERLATLLGVPWGRAAAGPFTAVYVNAQLTLDFIDDASDPLPILHFAFHVSDADFDAILGRIHAAGIGFRSAVHGATDGQVDTTHGGRIVYWNEPDDHRWELLTLSYARQPSR